MSAGHLEVERERTRRQIDQVRVAVWGSDEDIAALFRDHGHGPGRDETAEALAAFGLREVARDE